MKNSPIANLLIVIKNINEVASLHVDENIDDEHSHYTIKLNNPAIKHGCHEDENIDEIYKRDIEINYQHRIINPNIVLPDYGNWKLILPTEDITPDGPPSPIIYTTQNQDVFMINLTDYHIIFTVILSGMY